MPATTALTGSRPGVRRQRGAALLLVLWLLAMLTALIGAFALIAQMERLQARNLYRGVAAAQVARAGVEYALTRLASADPRLAWLPDGRTYQWTYHGAEVELTIVDERGKVDLNRADVTLLEALLRALGSESLHAGQLAAAIVDWRDPDLLTPPAGGAEDPSYAAAGRRYGAKDAPFSSIAELQQVLGMTPQLYAQLAPHITVFSGRMQPDPAYASAEVLTALGLDAARVLQSRRVLQPPSGAHVAGGGTYSIDSRARLPNGRQTVLRVVVRTATGPSGSTYTPLYWEEGVSPR